MKKEPTNHCHMTLAEKGLIVAHHGVAVEVLFRDGRRSMVKVKRNSGHVVGDDVTVTGEVLQRLPRRTELRRRDARGGIHLVASNLDVLGIVTAPLSPVSFIDRAVVSARTCGLTPFLVVNKSDLGDAEELIGSISHIYAGSISIFAVSATTGSGLKALNQFFSDGHRGAFVGNTGVGKSSLLNALCPEIDLKVGTNSDYKAMGRHTTTVSTLHALPGGGELVDTPGFRDFGLVEISAADLAEHFPGFEEHADRACRFSNCRHRNEPGCSVLELVRSGQVTRERYETYLELLEEIEITEAEARSRGWRR